MPLLLYTLPNTDTSSTSHSRDGLLLVAARVAADRRAVDHQNLRTSQCPNAYFHIAPGPPLTQHQAFLAIVTFGPWIAVLAYDVVLYLWRSATFELPQIGGRARGRQRPRAPSLKARPDGHRRRFSVASVAGVPVPVPSDRLDADGATNTSSATSTSTGTPGHKRNITATMSRPIFEFADDDE